MYCGHMGLVKGVSRSRNQRWTSITMANRNTCEKFGFVVLVFPANSNAFNMRKSLTKLTER